MRARVGLYLTVAALLVGSAGGAIDAAGPRRPSVVLAERVRITVDIVDTPAARSQGLSGRASLGEREGMLFVFERPEPQAFWMKDMRFDIDILWIRGGKLIGVAPNVPRPAHGARLPFYYSPAPCDLVLELRAGSAARWGIMIGDSVRVER